MDDSGWLYGESTRRDYLLRLALARRRRDWEEAVGLAHYCVVCLRLIDSLEASARAMRRRSSLNKTGG